jgi:hypothetical protein
VNLGQPIAIITDLNDTWVRAAIPETEAVHISLGDQLKVRLPSGDIVSGKVIFKAPEADFAHPARRKPPQARHQGNRTQAASG